MICLTNFCNRDSQIKGHCKKHFDKLSREQKRKAQLKLNKITRENALKMGDYMSPFFI